VGFCKHRAVRIPDKDTVGILWIPAARRSDVLSGLGVILVELQLWFRSSNKRALTDGDQREDLRKLLTMPPYPSGSLSVMPVRVQVHPKARAHLGHVGHSQRDCANKAQLGGV
jgi:hypothetical protein